jgi:hypothetical protein
MSGTRTIVALAVLVAALIVGWLCDGALALAEERALARTEGPL